MYVYSQPTAAPANDKLDVPSNGVLEFSMDGATWLTNLRFLLGQRIAATSPFLGSDGGGFLQYVAVMWGGLAKEGPFPSTYGIPQT